MVGIKVRKKQIINVFDVCPVQLKGDLCRSVNQEVFIV